MVPDGLRAEVAEIAARAAAAGRPLDALPVLEVAACRRQGSAAFIGRSGRREPARVRLAIKLLSQAPTERAWTIAHELSHVLRAQEGTRVRPSRARLVAGAVLIAAAVLGLATAGYVAVSGGTDVGVPLTAERGCDGHVSGAARTGPGRGGRGRRDGGDGVRGGAVRRRGRADAP